MCKSNQSNCILAFIFNFLIPNFATKLCKSLISHTVTHTFVEVRLKGTVRVFFSVRRVHEKMLMSDLIHWKLCLIKYISDIKCYWFFKCLFLFLLLCKRDLRIFFLKNLMNIKGLQNQVANIIKTRKLQSIVISSASNHIEIQRMDPLRIATWRIFRENIIYIFE